MKLRTSFRAKKAISPLIATLILIAVTIVGGVVVYRAFFAASNTVSSNLHAAIQDTSLSVAGGAALTIKNDGTTAVDWNQTSFLNGAKPLVVNGPGLVGTCDISNGLPSSGSLPPGSTVAVTSTGAANCLSAAIPGDTYVFTLQVAGPGVVGSVLTTSSAIAIA